MNSRVLIERGEADEQSAVGRFNKMYFRRLDPPENFSKALTRGSGGFLRRDHRDAAAALGALGEIRLPLEDGKKLITLERQFNRPRGLFSHR
jgi:hypothetical protein